LTKSSVVLKVKKLDDVVVERSPMPIVEIPTSPTHELAGARFTAIASPSRGGADASVWLVEVLPGHPATPHQVTAEEILVAIDGRAEGRLGDRAFEVAAGECIVVPPDTTFSLAAAGDRPFRAYAYLTKGGQARLEGGAPFTPPWAM
jgi:mannose-6-phosphate isomerase-like protein (cupin superfamily)